MNRFLEGGAVYRSDGQDGWTLVGNAKVSWDTPRYIEQADLDLADAIRQALHGLLSPPPVAVLPAWLSHTHRHQARLLARKYGFGGTVDLADGGAVSRTGEVRERGANERWTERWSRHMLNGPAAAGGGRWCSGRPRWSERAINTLADCYPRAEQRTKVLWAWASTPELQGTTEWERIHQLLDNRVAAHQQVWSGQWADVLSAIPRSFEDLPAELVNEGFEDTERLLEEVNRERINRAKTEILNSYVLNPPAPGYTEGGAVTHEMIEGWLQRSWEQSKGTVTE